VNFEFDGHMTSFRGTLTTFSADNLAAWSIGGFKALASAFRRCQFCMVTMDDMQEKVCVLYHGVQCTCVFLCNSSVVVHTTSVECV